jgi:putative flippase GtrA
MSTARRLRAFALVGSAAGAVHFATVAALVSGCGLAPLLANLFGFVLAATVSFAGHAAWTFPLAPAARTAAVPRFLVIAGCNFVLNQSAYGLGLEVVGPGAYLPLLLLVMVTAALVTFVLFRVWAFADSTYAHAPPHHQR